jgi:hypothetical protein
VEEARSEVQQASRRAEPIETLVPEERSSVRWPLIVGAGAVVAAVVAGFLVVRSPSAELPPAQRTVQLPLRP